MPAPESAAGTVLLRLLLSRLGGAFPARLGLSLHGDPEDRGLGRWLVAACLVSGRGTEDEAEGAYRALAEAGLADPPALGRANALAVAPLLAGTGIRDCEVQAVRLVRAGAALTERYAGSLGRLAADADSLEELAGRVASLAPGIGRATVSNFLRPLRECWPLADELPLSPAACAAAAHLGLLRPGVDEEAASAALAAALARRPQAPDRCDVEAALERLGRRACLRGATRRCPLESDCPARGSDEG